MPAPKVELHQIEAKIVDETYTVLPDGRTTICQLTLENGFTVNGISSCVSKANFDADIGNKYARERAVNACWELEGYLLAEKLFMQAISKEDEWQGETIKKDDVGDLRKLIGE